MLLKPFSTEPGETKWEPEPPKLVWHQTISSLICGIDDAWKIIAGRSALFIVAIVLPFLINFFQEPSLLFERTIYEIQPSPFRFKSFRYSTKFWVSSNPPRFISFMHELMEFIWSSSSLKNFLWSMLCRRGSSMRVLYLSLSLYQRHPISILRGWCVEVGVFLLNNCTRKHLPSYPWVHLIFNSSASNIYTACI